jgi:hypothetical protein
MDQVEVPKGVLRYMCKYKLDLDILSFSVLAWLFYREDNSGNSYGAEHNRRLLFVGKENR